MIEDGQHIELCFYTSPTEPERYELTIDEAREIAAKDTGLIYGIVTHDRPGATERHTKTTEQEFERLRRRVVVLVQDLDETLRAFEAEVREGTGTSLQTLERTLRNEKMKTLAIAILTAVSLLAAGCVSDAYLQNS